MRQLLTLYLDDAKDRVGLSLKTIATYRSHCNLLLDWLDVQLHRPCTVADFTLARLQSYDTARKRERKSQRTRAAQVCAFKAFGRWLADNSHITAETMQQIATGLHVKVSDAARRPSATDAQVAALFDACASVTGHRAHRRHLCAAVLACMAYAGLRRAEVCALALDDVELTTDQPTITVRFGKGGKTRTLPLHDDAVRHLWAWLEFRPRGLPDLFAVPIIRAQSGPDVVPLGENRLVGILRELCHIAKLPLLMPHSFRRFCATKLLEVRGSNLSYVRDMLGHSHISSTLKYIGNEPEKLRALVNEIAIETRPQSAKRQVRDVVRQTPVHSRKATYRRLSQ